MAHRAPSTIDVENDRRRAMCLDAIDPPDFEQATATAARAFQLMAQHKVPATPHNFEVWFAFAQGTSSGLNKTINILIDNKRPFDAATNRSLFQTYVDAQAEWDATHARISQQLHQAVASARAYLAKGISDNRDQVQTLGAVAANIGDDTSPRTIVQALVAELSKAVTRATALEANFNASLLELEQIRNHLSTAEQRSKTDALTGLANRHALDEFLRAAQLRAMEKGLALSIFLIDVDHFKKFNDQFGHQVGDQVLRLISQILKDGLRQQDLAARFGGEELMGVLPDTDLAACADVADRIRQTIGRRRLTRRASGEVLAAVTVSVGVAQFAPGETLADLFKRCDRALYAAKRGGRNRTVTELQLGKEAPPT